MTSSGIAGFTMMSGFTSARRSLADSSQRASKMPRPGKGTSTFTRDRSNVKCRIAWAAKALRTKVTFKSESTELSQMFILTLPRHLRAYHPDISDLAETFNSVAKPRTKTDHACTICGKTFTREFARRNHENSHRGVKPFSCPECGRAFTRRNDLVRHQKLHERV